MQDVFENFQNKFDSWLSYLVVQRSGLLMFCLLISGLNSLVFYFVHQPGYNHLVNLLASGLFFSLMPFALNERSYIWTVHTFLATAFLLVNWITSHTGGVNSPAMVWITVLTVPALLLAGQMSAYFWMGMAVLSGVTQYLAMKWGFIGSDVEMGHQTVAWALLDKLGVTLSLILAVSLYARLHDKKIQEVNLRNLQLEQMQHELLQARSHKDQFLASVGDELRAPINAILGLNGALVDTLGNQPDRVRMARQVGLSAERLLDLVNGILDFAQLQLGKVRLRVEVVHLRRLVDGVLARYVDQLAQKSLHLVVSIDPELPVCIETDAQRLQQVLLNLVDNAVKFTDQGGITIRFCMQNEQLRVEVEDSGRGIALQQQEQVFSSFEQSDVQTNRSYGGTGLGLAICEKLVALAGGQIGVRSALGQGAVIWFAWPFSRIDAQKVPPREGCAV